ncbi:ABC transporter ATP-binding protein [Oscillatoria sp. FACHB-1407]|uniref:ABC transporter ATP-binding protein n=1 Tax=Oscillatoria sp. FACHB-1407 TaxID=2692847 RepID=UPI0016824D49|nr:ABC transporter ATP-binding protein [Oscillatoria sp. FACHB-1407]MBD2459804.1 ABC transporter ATP-binding protein [Oscillatoria sp. FACHB-1407]
MVKVDAETKIAPPTTCIRIEGLSKSFAGQPLYDNFSLDLPNNEFISIFGPNGCGKSTLINMISGLLPFDSGQIWINDKPIRRARIGYVFQNYRDSLFPWLSAFDNIAYPLKAKGISERECRDRVEKLIATFDIRLDLRRYPYSFSGGQQQLISILRALVADPEVLFLDEPFSALDFETTLFVRDKLQEIFMTAALPMLMVVHNLEEAVYLADTVLLLSKRPTRLVERVSFKAPRPRTPDTLSSPEFVEVSRHCLDIFRQEMRK